MASKDKDMLDEYDFSNGVRGKYAARYQQASNIVRLDDDVAAMFPSAEKVNDALRVLGKLIRSNQVGGPQEGNAIGFQPD